MISAEELDVAVRSHRLHGQRFGVPSAPRLVIGLHGLAGNMKNLDFVGERVASEAVQLVALDLRGRGGSDTTPAGTYGWEEHARDVIAVADALGFERFSLIGQSMGGSVAIKVTELAGPRVDAVVLADVAGRVDRGVGAVIASVIEGIGVEHASVADHIDAVKARGLVMPWSDHWERAHAYELEEVDGHFRSRTSAVAVAEDRAYTGTQHPYERWRHLTMPTLLLRATHELAPGAGHVVPEGDQHRFVAEVPTGSVVEVGANHLTINTHPDTAIAIAAFLAATASG